MIVELKNLTQNLGYKKQGMKREEGKSLLEHSLVRGMSHMWVSTEQWVLKKDSSQQSS